VTVAAFAGIVAWPVGSQASPTPSPSLSVCEGLGLGGQLSVPEQNVLVLPGLQTLSRSVSTWCCEQPLASTGRSLPGVPGQVS